MLTYALLKEKPPVFEDLTGVTISQFNQLLGQVKTVWATRERNRLSRPDRQRAIGGGRNYALELQEQLLMTLIRLHLALNTEALGFFFGVDKSTASRNTRRMLAALNHLDQTVFEWPEPPRRGRAKTIEQALQDYPDLRTILPKQQTGHLSEKERRQETLSFLTGHVGGSGRPLSRIPLFQDLSQAELEVIGQAAYLRAVERHAFFYYQGDPATTFYLLSEGQVRLTEVTPEGHQLLVRFVSPGEALGIIAALENRVYPLTAQAVEDSLALAWDSTTLERLMERFPRLAINGLRLVSQRWQELEERYRELATERVERRIAQTLLRLVRQVGRKVRGGILIDLPLTRQDLAEMTGTTLYTVSRILSRWEQEQLVETGRERILICYPHGLARIAEDLPPAKSR